ncbi:hypothetical protein KDK_83160 [Dictyobacter kobayashii]|uniref:Uncharacterized protein n=1 Tax=Dictyobacter kobayashii TaxID=2014872 RepID=A0A402AZI3_9CHLR|nr:hypothetical protein KDK_83160 [Dictyobacter kobayashii]
MDRSFVSPMITFTCKEVDKETSQSPHIDIPNTYTTISAAQTDISRSSVVSCALRMMWEQ